MLQTLLWSLALGSLSSIVSAITPSATTTVKRAPPSNFITTSEDGQFMVNGSAIQFVGTNAYWLSSLNTEEDINNVFSNMSAVGINLVRTWAFNDVTSIPENGTWFQLISNGTLTINNGTNGLPRLDTVIRLAQNHGIYLLLSLTNNWNPLALQDNSTDLPLSQRDVTPGTNNSLPRNFLSNDYGGMDTYVRQFGGVHEHDQFFVNQTLINAFMNYTTQVVTRYVHSPAVLAWELANDPRCNSSLAASPTCQTTDISQWHSTLAIHVSSQDPNHLVSAGTQGFFCADCIKLFSQQPPPPPRPRPSPSAGQRRSVARPLTKARILKERKAAWQKSKERNRRLGIQMPAETQTAGGVRVRGRWVASKSKRQDDVGVGSAFDGSQGVDSEDIINIPQIGFASFQLFPDQNSYGPNDPSLPAFNNTVEIGLNWISRHLEAARSAKKPIALTGFGLVTQASAPSFVPFNSSVAPFGPDSGFLPTPGQQPFGVTNQQRDAAYFQWLSAALLGGLNGVMQYQWGQGNLTAEPGTAISPTPDATGLAPIEDQTGLSPDDGYSIQNTEDGSVQSIISQVSQQFGTGL